jgi:hypothetical protein
MEVIEKSPLEKFKMEIENTEKLLTQPPGYIYSRLPSVRRFQLLVENSYFDKKELEEYAKRAGVRYLGDLEWKHLPLHIAERVKKKMFKWLRKSIKKMKKTYKKMLRLNNKIEKFVKELEKKWYRPFVALNGLKYNGDISYPWVSYCIENKFGKYKDEMLSYLIYSEVVYRLKRDGYYVYW